MEHPDIWFYNLNISFNNIDTVAFTIFGISIFWYGIIIVTAVCAGYLVAAREAKRTGQKVETYSDLLLYVLITSVIGARLYFIAFSDALTMADFFDFRSGGLAIYGVVFAAIPTAIIFAKRKKINQWQLMDTGIFGLITGQIIGRWGNFINREAFGSFTDNIFAMRLRVDQLAFLPYQLTDTIINVDGVEYVQVHPTFFYESMLNLGLLGFMHFHKHNKKFHGEILMVYFIGYGTVRAVLETLRVDSLMIGPLRTSVLASIVLVTLGIYGMWYGRKNGKLGK
ncbi:MAG: prolipoprotein diacylglyceryl transferase [Defluviitaleaceae bacterium]|nr:prolipoprotein diacylglyceryl transferase [Defluviitaleaceae bacterium]